MPRLLGWMRRFGTVGRSGWEGTGTYGTGLCRLIDHGVEVIEVNRPTVNAAGCEASPTRPTPRPPPGPCWPAKPPPSPKAPTARGGLGAARRSAMKPEPGRQPDAGIGPHGSDAVRERLRGFDVEDFGGARRRVRRHVDTGPTEGTDVAGVVLVAAPRLSLAANEVATVDGQQLRSIGTTDEEEVVAAAAGIHRTGTGALRLGRGIRRHQRRHQAAHRSPHQPRDQR
jgi:hypothetical protein